MARQSLDEGRIETMEKASRPSCTTSFRVQEPEQQQIEHIGGRDILELDIVNGPVSTVGGHVMLFGHVRFSISKPCPRQRPTGTVLCNSIPVDLEFALDDRILRLPKRSIYNVICIVYCRMT